MTFQKPALALFYCKHGLDVSDTHASTLRMLRYHKFNEKNTLKNMNFGNKLYILAMAKVEIMCYVTSRSEVPFLDFQALINLFPIHFILLMKTVLKSLSA